MTVTKNVDEAEIVKFSLLAQDWWNPFGNCQPLHEINPLRLEFIKQYACLDDMRIVDVGCGGGILTESLAKSGAKVSGIDLSEQAIEIAAHHAKEQNLSIDYQYISVEDYAAEFAGEFDVLTCMELLEHVPDPVSVITSCAKLLKPQGHLFLSTLNRNLKAYLYAILGAEYLLKLLPKGTHHYEKFIKPSEMFTMLQDANLHLSHMAGMKYQPISRQYQLTSDVSVNYLVHAIKLEKILS